jgi:hypothetical protein
MSKTSGSEAACVVIPQNVSRIYKAPEEGVAQGWQSDASIAV